MFETVITFSVYEIPNCGHIRTRVLICSVIKSSSAHKHSCAWCRASCIDSSNFILSNSDKFTLPEKRVAVNTSGSCFFSSLNLLDGTRQKKSSPSQATVLYTKSVLSIFSVNQLCGVLWAIEIQAGRPS